MVWLALALVVPEVASLQLHCTVTGPLFQPAALGAVRLAKAMVGLVASRLIVTLWLLVPPALLAEQVKLTPLVSLVTLVLVQPLCELIADSLSTTLQLIVTSLMYQPLL